MQKYYSFKSGANLGILTDKTKEKGAAGGTRLRP
jgi:hypothetical protein